MPEVHGATDSSKAPTMGLKVSGIFFKLCVCVREEDVRVFVAVGAHSTGSSGGQRTRAGWRFPPSFRSVGCCDPDRPWSDLKSAGV